MANTESDLADCVGAIYEAAANRGSWQAVGELLCHLMGAQTATLRIGDERGGVPQNILMPTDASETTYRAYYHALNPFMDQAHRDYRSAGARILSTTRLGSEVVPDQLFLKSEYYSDFARHHERRHLVAGLVGVARPTPIALFRADGNKPFGSRERRVLQTLLPHLQRALELNSRLGKDSQSAWATRAALDALPVSVVLVDAGLRVDFLNEAARNYLDSTDSGLRALRSGPQVGSGVYLAPPTGEETGLLRKLVASAIAGNSGGSMRVTNRDMSSCAVLVSPAPRSLAAEANVDPGLAENLALVLMRDLHRSAPPSTDTLCEVFGFSKGEADVAAALSGGASAEDVARQRRVSLVTVRSQIRAILEKSEAENLRDLERSMALLAALGPRSPQKKR